MANRKELELFIERMEQLYHPSQRYAGRARDILSKMLDPAFPPDQAPHIFALAEDMYRSHAMVRENIDAAKNDLNEISSNVRCVAGGLAAITDAYASSVKMIVRAGEDLHDTAQAQRDASIELLGAAICLQDAAEEVNKMKRDEDALFAPPKKRYES